MTILVTGGAGFIGSNFVLDWLARERRAGRQPRQAHLRRQPREPRGARGRRAPRLRARRHRRPRAASTQLLARAPAARGRALRRREPRRPLDPRAGGVRPDQRRRHVHAARGRARPTGGALARRRSASVPLPARLHRRGLRLARARRSRVHRDHAVRAEQPLLRVARPARDHLVRAYHHTYGLPALTTNCSNNYGPFQFPEKLIPLMIVNALEGKPLPVYGDGQQRARLALRRRPLRGDPRACSSAGGPGETYNIGGGSETTQPRGRARDLRRARRAAPGARAATAALITFVTDRPGHDRRYAIDAAQDPRASSAGRRARPSRRACAKTVRWYLDHADWVAQVTSGEYRDWIETNYAKRSARMKRKGIILAGGSGTRLYPVTQRGLQAAAAGLRQADDLLPALHADAGGHPRHPGHLHAAGHAALRRSCWATAASGASTLSLRGAAAARRARAGVHHRARLRRPATRRAWSSATTSSTATTSRARCSARPRTSERAPRSSPTR